jgi:hypothetical protein
MGLPGELSRALLVALDVAVHGEEWAAAVFSDSGLMVLLTLPGLAAGNFRP